MRLRRPRNQRGAAMVEFALIGPIFILLVMGMLEYGLVFRDYLTVANTTRAGARVASSAGKIATADYLILQSVKSAAGAVPQSSIQKVIVFRSDANGTMNPTCKTSSVVNSYLTPVLGCNVYSSSDLDLTQAALASSGKSNSWLPTTRIDTQSGTGSDYIGVWIQVDHVMATKMFGSTFTLTDKTIMRVEPTLS